jgi:hypothetical protein
VLAKTNDYQLCQEFVVNYVHELNRQFHECILASIKQSQSCPSTLLPLETLDERLTEFVCLQRNYLFAKKKDQLKRFQDLIRERELFQSLMNHDVIVSQVYKQSNTIENTRIHVLSVVSFVKQKEAFNQLMTLCQVQLQIFEEFTMFEQRIRCNFLSREFDHLERSVAPDIYWPMVNDRIAVEFEKKRYKIVQEAKRTLLNNYLHAFEMKIQEYENQYQQDLNKFQQMMSNNMDMNETTLLDCIVTYMDHRTNRMEQEIYDKIPSCRRKLLRRRQRSSSSTKKIVSVCPKVIVDVNHVPLNVAQLAYLSRGKTLFSISSY